MWGICESCGEESAVTVIDNGIGHYEYWGAKCYDSQPEAVSECCEAPIFDEHTGSCISEYDVKYEQECARADYEIEMAEERRLFPDEWA